MNVADRSQIDKQCALIQGFIIRKGIHIMFCLHINRFYYFGR